MNAESVVELHSDKELTFHSGIKESQGLESCLRWGGPMGLGRLCEAYASSRQAGGSTSQCPGLLLPDRSLLCSGPGGAQEESSLALVSEGPSEGPTVQVGDADT